MPVRDLGAPARPAQAPRSGAVTLRRLFVGVLTLVAVVLLGWAMVRGLMRDGFDIPDMAILALFLPNIVWIAFAAATALGGFLWYRSLRRAPVPPVGWVPRERTAVLVPARNEAVGELEGRLEAMRADLVRRGLGGAIDIFVLSDSDDPRILRAEQSMAQAFACVGDDGQPPVYYRRREDNAGRKPGNIAEWIGRWGGGYAYMLVLDADSRMSADRIAALVAEMEARPEVGLIQTGVRLTGATTRFGRLLQASTRLYGPAFTAGIAGWAGGEGNYWGHNALIRVRAFAGAAGLPRLSGRAPFGGDILSHDFVEAAWMRRAGWAVVIDPDGRGSAEGGPDTLAQFHKRDRRWCQGNLQHLRVLPARGLHGVSRLHLVCGIGSYLAAPLWLGLVAVATLLGTAGNLIVPLVGALGLILVQKIAGIGIWLRRRPGVAGKVLRMSVAEIAVSSVIAPIIMVRQTLSVVSVFAGNDCGWKPQAGAAGRGSDEMPWLEPAVAACLLLAVLPGAGSFMAVALILPIAGPLFAAPLITQLMDLQPGQLPSWRPQPAPARPVVPVQVAAPSL